MKKAFLRNLLFASLLITGVSVTSCGKNNQSEGTEDAQEANGDTYGTESAMDNEGSGSAAGTGNSDGGMATDTVTGTTGNGSATGAGSGTGSGTNSGTGTGTGTGGTR